MWKLWFILALAVGCASASARMVVTNGHGTMPPPTLSTCSVLGVDLTTIAVDLTATQIGLCS
jgi:hypothetical protein